MQNKEKQRSSRPVARQAALGGLRGGNKPIKGQKRAKCNLCTAASALRAQPGTLLSQVHLGPAARRCGLIPPSGMRLFSLRALFSCCLRKMHKHLTGRLYPAGGHTGNQTELSKLRETRESQRYWQPLKTLMLSLKAEDGMVSKLKLQIHAHTQKKVTKNTLYKGKNDIEK